MSSKRGKMRSRRRRAETGPTEAAARFYRLIRSISAIRHYALTLFVTGTTIRSAQAIATIRSLCEEHLKGRYDLEVVDIYQKPGEALNGQIIAAPTLIKKSPLPTKRIVGNLADRERVLAALDVPDPPSPVPSRGD
jgi:circadian clock protein KaiB